MNVHIYINTYMYVCVCMCVYVCVCVCVCVYIYIYIRTILQSTCLKISLKMALQIGPKHIAGIVI